MFDTLSNIMFVPLFNITAISIVVRNINGSMYDSHIIINIIVAPPIATTNIHIGNIGVLASAISPAVYVS